MASPSSRSRKIRVFLSSTFKDMNAERDYLVNYIFPQIADYCRQRALEFVPIDLRWGITEEESRNSAVLNSCLEEVNNSRPFFIGILGDRYGWSPGIEELENLGLELMREQEWLLEKVAEGASITEMEIDYGVLRDRNIRHAAFFIRNQDATPPEHREKPGSIPEKKLRALKDKIRRQTDYPVFDYKDIATFGETLRSLLINMINEEYPESEFDHEDAIMAPHEQQLEYLAENACEVPLVMEYFHRWLNDNHPLLLIVGASGSGTSSAISLIVEECRDNYATETQKILYFNFECLSAGANPISAFYEFMSLKSSYIDPGAWSLIAIDNISTLNQEEIEMLMDWMSNQSPNTHIILGVSDDSMAYDSIGFRYEFHRITFRGYKAEYIEQSATTYLKRFGKRLNQQQIGRFAEEQTLGNALNLKLVLDAIISHGDFETLDAHISKTLESCRIGNLFWESMRYYEEVYRKVGLLKEFYEGMIGISLSPYGISEQDLMKALDIPQAKWSAVRPIVMRFCKGSSDSLRLARKSWQNDLKILWQPQIRTDIGTRITNYLLKEPERQRKNASTIAAIYNDISHLAFDEKGTKVARKRKEYEDSLIDFATSYDTVMNVAPGLLSTMLANLYKIHTNEIPIRYDSLTEQTKEEKTAYFLRIARTFSGSNESTMASNCHQKLSDILMSEDDMDQACFFRSMALLEKGKAKDALDILKKSGLLEYGWIKGFGWLTNKKRSSAELRLKALALEIRILSMTGKLQELKKRLTTIMKEFDRLDVSGLSKTSRAESLHAIVTAVRTLSMMKFLSNYSDESATKILNKYDKKIRALGLASEAAYELTLARSIIAYYKGDSANLSYWSYYCIKSADLVYGAVTNHTLNIFNHRSYQYSRACNLYAIAYWHINKQYYDWHRRGYKQRFYESLTDVRTIDKVDLTKLKDVDMNVKQSAELERMWFLKAVQSIQPPEKQKEIEEELSNIEASLSGRCS